MVLYHKHTYIYINVRPHNHITDPVSSHFLDVLILSAHIYWDHETRNADFAGLLDAVTQMLLGKTMGRCAAGRFIHLFWYIYGCSIVVPGNKHPPFPIYPPIWNNYRKSPGNHMFTNGGCFIGSVQSDPSNVSRPVPGFSCIFPGGRSLHVESIWIYRVLCVTNKIIECQVLQFSRSCYHCFIVCHMYADTDCIQLHDRQALEM